MRLIKAYILLAVGTAVLLAGCKNEDPNSNSFDNKIYISSLPKVNTLLIKPTNTEASMLITASIAKPAGEQIDLVYAVDLPKVDTYNMANYTNAIALPEGHYTLLEEKAVILKGSVKSTDAIIHFSDIDKLDRTLVYVLPVTMQSATGIDMLESARTIYYLFKGGSLIDVVGNIRENSLSVNWADASACNGLTQLTMEMLIRAKAYEKISSVMGIEGQFLMRIGDTDRDWSQLQIATRSGNFPGKDVAKNLPKGEWIHIALAYDLVSGAYTIYVNGKMQTEATGPKLGSVNLGTSSFFIGKSYDDSRWLDGDIAECRIWNVIRTAEQIAANPYSVDPASEGLRAYWKFDDGSGDVVKDHTSYGNHAKALKPIKWLPVMLPAN